MNQNSAKREIIGTVKIPMATASIFDKQELTESEYWFGNCDTRVYLVEVL